MKRKNIVIIMLLVLSGLFTMQSCKKDDTTFSEKQAFTKPVSTLPVVSEDGTLLFTGSTVELAWASENTGGDAVSWNVYFGTGKAPALDTTGYNKQTYTVPVIDGQTYYWKVEIVDSRGIKTTSDTWSFTAVNGTNPKMNMALTASTDVLTAIGVDLGADDVVDLRLLIIDANDSSIVEVVDGGYANEIYTNFQNLPDGDYIIGVDLFSAVNFGDINSTITIGLTLDFFQLGLVNSKLEFPSVMTNLYTCDNYSTYLATVTKAGALYTIARAVSSIDGFDYSALAGTWQGFDFGYSSQVISAITDGTLFFDGIGTDWMFNDWGEVIITHTPIKIEFNHCNGTLIIPEQEIMTTTWLGDPQPTYYIFGEGTFDLSGAYPVLNIIYNFNQPDGGGTIAKYFGEPYFVLDLTLDPAGFPVAPKKSVHKVVIPVNK